MHSIRRLPLTIKQTFRPLRRCLTSKPAEEQEVTKIPEDNEKKEDSILVEQGVVTMIGINRPDKKNCLDASTAEKLSEAFDEFEKDDGARVCVVHGVGGNFCAGYDLAELAKYDGESESSVPQYGTLANRVELSSKPVIAAITGHAIGAGLELALMCDVRIVDETASMGFLNRRFGVPILSGGTVRLPAMIGYSRAMYLILSGLPINAKTAHEWGLATVTTACGASLGQALNLARSLLKFPQKAMMADKASLRFAAFHSKQFEEALQFEKDNGSHLLLEEGVPGAKKFIEGIGRGGKSTNLKEQDDSIKEISKDLL